MSRFENIIIGCSSMIGVSMIKKIDQRNTIFTSRKKLSTIKKGTWIKQDLNKKINSKIPKKVKKIFFLSSPYYMNRNLFKKNSFKVEVQWIKKVIQNISCEKFIYISSSSVYEKNHVIGVYKKKCENIIKNSKIKYIQIWRPFNLVGYKNGLSDHFHNLLIKLFYIKRKKKHFFRGSQMDKKGYSSVEKFVSLVFFYSKLNKSFIYNYRNNNLIYVDDIVKIFQVAAKKTIKIEFSYSFKNKKKNLNKIQNKVRLAKNVFSRESSKNVLKNYYNKVFNRNAKLLQHL